MRQIENKLISLEQDRFNEKSKPVNLLDPDLPINPENGINPDKAKAEMRDLYMFHLNNRKIEDESLIQFQKNKVSHFNSWRLWKPIINPIEGGEGLYLPKW